MTYCELENCGEESFTTIDGLVQNNGYDVGESIKVNICDKHLLEIYKAETND